MYVSINDGAKIGSYIRKLLQRKTQQDATVYQSAVLGS
jgi:hypothetical protein